MKKMLHKGFNPAKCKTSLKMAVSRVKILRNKKEIQLKQLKREVAQLLEAGQDQTARIRVEHVVREEKTIAAYDLIDIYCELIVARLPIIESQKNCPIDLKEAIASVIFASPRCSDIPELMDVRKHFTAKYGRDFVTAAIELRPDCGVNRTLIEKLSANSPDGPTKVKILTGIAEEHNIKWEPNWFKDKEAEPPAYVLNEPHVDKINKMHAEPSSFQAAPTFEPKDEVPSHVHNVAGSEMSQPKFSYYSAARPSGSEPETVEFSQSSGGAEDPSLVDRQKWNMEFKDASAAAHAAAESAELASMAARAAAELASRGNFMDHTTADSKYLQNDGNRGQIRTADRGGPVENFPKDSSFHESPSTMERMQRDPNQQIKTSGMIDEDSFKKDYHQSVKHDRPNSFQQSNSSVEAVQKDGNQQYIEKESTHEVKPKMDYKQSSEQYDVGIEDEHDSSPEDPPEFLRKTPTSQVDLHYDHDTFSYSDRRHDDDSAENPFADETVETRNQPSSYWSQSGGMSRNYGVTSSSNLPKYDSELDEDPFGSTGHGNFYEEDVETQEPFGQSGIHSTVSHIHKDDFYAFSEQRKYGFESYEHPFVDAHDGSMHTEKERTNTYANNAPPSFDDYLADEDDHIQSPRRKSPAYSSPEDSSPKKLGISFSKIYQPELSESFKNTPLYSQLVKPVSLGDDSDGANSENEEEVQKSGISERAFARNVVHSSQVSENEHRGPHEFVGSSNVGRGTSAFISEQPNVEGHSEECLEKDFSASNRDKFDSGDMSTIQHSSRRTRSKSDAKSFDRQSFSRLVEEADRLSSLRASSLQTMPEVTDDSQYSHQPNAESRTELNVESLTGGLRNKGYRRPPYSRGTSTSSSALSTSDDTPEVRQSSNTSSSEIKQLSSQKENISKKKTGRLQGTYIDPNGDEPVQNAEWKGSISVRHRSDKRDYGNVNQRSSSRVPQSHFDSEDNSSGDDVVKPIVSSKARPGTGFSRRTRGSGPSYASGSSTGTRASYEASSAVESVSEKKPSSSTSNAVHTSVKPKTKPVIQMESFEPQRRREEDNSRPSLSKMSSREEISSPLDSRKQATSSKEGTLGSETAEVPKTSSSNEKTLLRDTSDKRASHVHPKLPDYDDFASHFRSLRKDRQ